MTQSNCSHLRGRRAGERWPTLCLPGVLFLLALGVLSCSISTVAPSPVPPQVGAGGSPVSPSSFGFAVLNAVPDEGVSAGNVEEIRAQFRTLKQLGVNIVAQSFDPASTATDWQAYLDTAQQEDLKVVGWFRSEPPVWNGSGFDLGVNQDFLAAAKDHPALYGFLLVDEPFHRRHNWDITAERLQMLYQQAKQIAPDVLMAVQYSREISKAESQGNTQYAFKSGQCDLCIISALEFRNYGDVNLFDSETLRSNQSVSRAVIQREAPNAQMWTTVQVFGSASGSSTYYMPSADELQQMVDMLLSPELQAAGALDGMVFQQWASFSATRDTGQYTLSDPQFETQRGVVLSTAARLNLITP